MKKHILLGAALLTLMATSCSNDDVIDNGTEVVTGKTITLNATINNGADTRLAYTDDETAGKMTVAWSSEESFTMYRGTNDEGSTFKNTSTATGTFTGNDIEGEDTYYAVYGNDITNSAGTLTIDLSGDQVGTAADNGIKEFMLATADALNSSTTLNFDHKLTVLKMTLTLPSDVTGPVSKVTVSGLHNKATYTLSTSSYAYADTDKKDITATNGKTGFAITENKITAYVAVFPENVSANQVTIKATVGDNEYSYTIANEKTLPENKVVPVKVTLAAPVQTNLKSEYTGDDYKTWSEENCRSAVSVDDMCKYLGAGVYWDAGTDNTDGKQQTYTLPNGETYHEGLWLMKKAYISGFSDGTAKEVTKVSSSENSDCWHKGRPAAEEIGKYFFLPAAGCCYGSFYATKSGYYWSSSLFDDGFAFCLGFDDSNALVNYLYCGCGCLPMAAE